ncbi:DUF2865 domain-containing protein [Xanthobacter sp. TB0139]|uniref:DUF2865 domain-containing protein n=1 Tax=Xanthobacter sp. TB0139 TaxID=3459178 RepID=UPI00403922BE
MKGSKVARQGALWSLAALALALWAGPVQAHGARHSVQDGAHHAVMAFEGLRAQAPEQQIIRAETPVFSLFPSAAQRQAQGPKGVRVAQWGRPASPIESFFSTLFGGGRRPPPQQEAPRPRVLITPGEAGTGRAGAVERARPRGGSTAFCVRSCDGRFFPLGARVSRASYGAGQSQCQSMCPGADMQLFTSSGSIDTAVSIRGTSYVSMPTAYLFRKKLVEGCSCTGGSVGGLRHVDIKNDPTLRKGDVVMTETGPRIFTGSRKKGPPYRDADFVQPSKFPRLSKEMRQRLKELTMASSDRNGG